MAQAATKRAGGNRAPSWAAAAACAVYAFLLIYRLGAREFWLDEFITARRLGANLGGDFFHPPGYYWLLRQWSHELGSDDGALRGFSVLCALLAALLLWAIARQLLRPWPAALAVWLWVLSPTGLLYMRMARYFALTAAVALLVAYLALHARRVGRRRSYLGLGLAAAGLLLTNYAAACLLPLAFVWVLPAARRQRRGAWWLAALALPAALLLYRLPLLLFGVRSIAEMEPGPLAFGLRAVLTKLGFVGYSALLGETTDFWRLGVVVPVALAGVLLAIAGVRAFQRDRGGERWLPLVAWPAAVAVVTLLMSRVWSPSRGHG